MAETTTAVAALRTCVVIVNYRTSEHVVRCLETLEEDVAALEGSEVVVVDNASGDGSAERLRAAIAENGWGDWARVVESDVNGGFAAGNNLAFRANLEGERPAECFHLLNPDTWVRPGAVRRLAEFLRAHPDVGIVGSALEDPDGTPQSSCFRSYDVLGEFNSGIRLGLVSRLLANHVTTLPHSDETREVEWVAGASMMVRREVLDDVGPMDDRFFLYYEEADYQLRARRAGWSIWHVSDAHVVHIMGASTGVTGEAERVRRRPRYWFESRRRFFRRNHGVLYAVLMDLAWFTGFSLWRLRRRVQRKPDLDPPGLWWDFLRYSLLGLR